MKRPGAVLALVIMAAAAGWLIADAADVRPWMTALAAGAAAAGGAAPSDRPGIKPVAAAAVGLVILRMLAISGGAGAGVIIDRETGVSFVMAVLAWAGSRSTVTDLDLVERGVETVMTSRPPAAAVRRRFATWAVGLTAAAAFVRTGLVGMLDLRRAPVGDVPVPLVVFIVLGLMGMGAVGRLRVTAGWRRDRTTVDPGVVLRWQRMLVVLVAGTIALGVAGFVAGDLLGSAPAVAVRSLGRPAGQVADWLAHLGDRPAAPVDRAPSDGASGRAPATRTGEAPPWVGEVAFWVVVAIFAGTVFVRPTLRRRAARGARRTSASAWGLLVGVAGALAEAVRWLIDALARLFPARPSRAGRADGVDAGGGGSTRWTPDDPVRKAIVETFRKVERRADDRRVGRAPSETPAEFTGRLAGVVVEPDGLTALATLYEEARYSTHRLDQDAARSASEIEAGLAFAEPGAGDGNLASHGGLPD